jgi:putative FmdB family regulatory protein
MPIYQYNCEQCGHRFDLRRRIDESDSELKCAKCGCERPRRVISTFSTCSLAGSCAPQGGG